MSALNKNTRGSIIIAALIITLVTGTLVGLFLKTVSQEVANSHRARMGFQAVNISEAGIEYAMYAMMHDTLDSSWTKTKGGGYYKDSFPHIDIFSESQNPNFSLLYFFRKNLRKDLRELRVYVEPEYVTTTGETVPVVISQGSVTLRNGMLTSKQIRVQMEKGSTKPWNRGFGNGVLGKDSVRFVGGNVFMDSYDSSNGPYDTTTNRKDNGSIASNAVQSGAIDIGNATVVGRAATGGGNPDVGPKGSICSLEDFLNMGKKKGVIDWDRIALDFYADLPDPVVPTFNNPSTSYSGNVIGTPGMETQYTLDEIDVDSGDVLKIKGDVQMIVTGDFLVGGEIQITAGSSLEVYIAGDVDVRGNGMINLTNKPPSLLMYATGKDTMFKLHGNGAFSGAVYAPNSTVDLKGGGATGVMFGAVVGKSVFFNGNYEFHYDEDLANLNPDNDDDGDFVPVVTSWRELQYDGERITSWEDLLESGLQN